MQWKHVVISPCRSKHNRHYIYRILAHTVQWMTSKREFSVVATSDLWYRYRSCSQMIKRTSYSDSAYQKTLYHLFTSWKCEGRSESHVCTLLIVSNSEQQGAAIDGACLMQSDDGRTGGHSIHKSGQGLIWLSCWWWHHFEISRRVRGIITLPSN